MRVWAKATMVLLLVIAGTGIGRAQEPFSRSFVTRVNGPVDGFDQVKAVTWVPGGDIVAVGTMRGTGDVFEMLVVRVRPDGTPSPDWADTGSGVGIRRYRSFSGSTTGEAVSVGSDGSLYVGATSQSLENGDDYLVFKYDSAGSLSSTWATTGSGVGIRRYSQISGSGATDQLKAVAATRDGGVLVTGRSVGSGTFPAAVTIKFGSTGNTVWGRPYVVTSGPSEGLKVLEMPDGGALVGGRTTQSVNGRSAYLVLRTNSAGSLTSSSWNIGGGSAGIRVYNGVSGTNSELTDIALLSTGVVVATGRSVNANGLEDVVTLAYGTNGSLLWESRRRGDAAGNHSGQAVVALPDGDIAVLSRSWKSTTGDDFELARLTSAGALSAAWPDVGHGVGLRRWDGGFGGNDLPIALAVDPLGNLFAAGRRDRGAGTHDAAVVKFTASGAQAWTDAYDGPGSGLDQLDAVTVTSTGLVYGAGVSAGGITGSDALLVGYSQTYPTLTSAPAARTFVQGGGALRFQASATGNPGLTYTWSKGGTVIGTGADFRPGVLDATTAGTWELAVSDGYNVSRLSFDVAGLRAGPAVGGITIRSLGAVGRSYRIESAPGPGGPWTTWQTFTQTAAELQFTAPIPAAPVFYRLRQP